MRRLGLPRPARVAADAGGAPRRFGAVAVAAIAEEWLVEDRWWTETPVRRRYFELVLADGSNEVVFVDLLGGGWFAQRG
jgi:hypothetical protein